MKAKIDIKGLRITSRLGVGTEERRVHQPLEVDLVLEYDVRAAVEGDSIEAAVDYSAVASSVVAWAAEQETALIETLGVNMADHLLAHWRSLETVSVALRKYPIPRATAVEFRIDRARKEPGLDR